MFAWSRTFYAENDGKCYNFEAKRDRDEAVQLLGFKAISSGEAYRVDYRRSDFAFGGEDKGKTEMRLIDADALKEYFGMSASCEDCKQNTRECGNMYSFTRMDLCSIIDDAPTVDAVPVVRCKDCINHGTCTAEETFLFCGIKNPFCSVGKRKKEC